MKRIHKGFTLIELMIVIAIIGVLASVAMPAYQTYTKRAKFAEVVLATTSYKTPIEIAYATDRHGGLNTGRFTGLNGGTLGIPPNKVTCGAGTRNANCTTGQFVQAVSATNGIITATGTINVDSRTYILTPQDNGGAVRWTATGTCLDGGLC